MPWEVLSSSRGWERWGPIHLVPPQMWFWGWGLPVGSAPPPKSLLDGDPSLALTSVALPRSAWPWLGIGAGAWWGRGTGTGGTGMGFGALSQAGGLEMLSGGGKEGSDPVPLLPAPPVLSPPGGSPGSPLPGAHRGSSVALPQRAAAVPGHGSIPPSPQHPSSETCSAWILEGFLPH